MEVTREVRQKNGEKDYFTQMAQRFAGWSLIDIGWSWQSMTPQSHNPLSFMELACPSVCVEGG